MLRYFCIVAMAGLLCLPAFAIERRHGILVGEAIKLDAGAKTMVVKLGDGTEQALHFVKRTTVHGAEGVAKGAEDTFHGLRAGTNVAVHYTAKGTEKTAEEVDNIGKGGLKATDVTVTHIDRAGKILVVKTADGGKETYRLTDNAAKDTGKDIAEGSEKSVKVTVYYTEEGGHKIAHFFRRAI